MSDAKTVKEEGLQLFRAGRHEEAAAKFAEAQQLFADEGNQKEFGDFVRDVDGKFYGKESMDAATPEGVWVDYRRANPATGTWTATM